MAGLPRSSTREGPFRARQLREGDPYELSNGHPIACMGSGDRHGTSCAAELSDAAESILVRLGYDVSRNRPYAGGYITEHYGRPASGVHALQIEINRALYLNERTLEKTGSFPRLLANLTVFSRTMIGAAGALLAPRAEAAE